jgi:hypothetical protein
MLQQPLAQTSRMAENFTRSQAWDAPFSRTQTGAPRFFSSARYCFLTVEFPNL